MEISIKFTQEELKIISKALHLGIVHSDNDSEVEKMQILDRKLNIVAMAEKSTSA